MHSANLLTMTSLALYWIKKGVLNGVFVAFLFPVLLLLNVCLLSAWVCRLDILYVSKNASLARFSFKIAWLTLASELLAAAELTSKSSKPAHAVCHALGLASDGVFFSFKSLPVWMLKLVHIAD